MRNLPKASEITGEKPAKSIMKEIGKSLLRPKKKKSQKPKSARQEVVDELSEEKAEKE